MGLDKLFKRHILLSGGYKGGPATQSDISGGKVYKLSSNENVVGAAPSAVNMVQSHIDLNLYPPGTPQPLYEALELHYDHALSHEHFIAGNGGSDLLQLITQAFLCPDTNYIISNPCFSPYEMFSSWTGAKAIDVPLLDPDYRLDVTGILSAITDNTRLIFLTAPNNPTGTYIRKVELEEIISAVPSHVIVIYDEVYHHFVEAQDYTTALPYVQSGKSIIALNSFSKAYGLAGLRVGYGYTTPQISNYVRKLIRPFLINSVSLNAAIAALADDSFLKQTTTMISRERRRVLAGLTELGIRHWPTEGNFVLVQTSIPEDILSEQISQLGVMVRPARNFGAPGCIRITIGDAHCTDATLRALATILAK